MPSARLRALLPVLLGLAAGAATARAQDSATARTARVSYVAGTAIYVTAGRDDGLAEGQELGLIRADTIAATLAVRYLSSHQASCEVVRGATDISVGETVRYTPRGASPTTPVAAAATPRRPRRLSGAGLHGRVGARYLVSRDDATGTGFSQPSLDLRLDGAELGGTPLGLVADLRTRRTTTTQGSGSSVDGHTRVYQAALRWSAPGTPFRASVGRQYLTQVTSVSLFDGALVELAGQRFTFGAFGGVEPEPVNLGFSSETQDAGGYAQIHSRRGGAASWALSAGAVGSYRAGKANREFGFLQGNLSTPRVSLYALQELDYYRPWKVQQGENSLSPTSTFLSGSLRPARWLAVSGSFDNRRSVRLYRDAVDPATQFDDAYRKGVSAGLSLIGRRVRVGGDLRLSDGGTGGRATAYTATAGLDRFTALGLSLTGRATWYHNSALDGRLYAMRIGSDPFPALRVELEGGLRNEDAPLDVPSSRRTTWFGADLDLSLARAWFASLSAQRESGPDARTVLVYAGVSWRF
jgi:hypothetical protein